MEQDIFKERERALEAVYFHDQDAKLIEKLRESDRLAEIAVALAEKLQVDNPELLRRVMELGVTLATAPAFLLAPLVQVAWAGEGHRAGVQDSPALSGCPRRRGELPRLRPATRMAPGASTGRSLRHGNGGHQGRALGPPA